jgi:hypothetical protein
MLRRIWALLKIVFCDHFFIFERRIGHGVSRFRCAKCCSLMHQYRDLGRVCREGFDDAH